MTREALPRTRFSASPGRIGSKSAAALRLLLVGVNYAPEFCGIAPYTTGLADHFASRGHCVRVITGIPHYPEWRARPAPSHWAGSNPSLVRYWHFVPARATTTGRFLFEFTWLLSASRGLLGASCDAVIGVIPSLSGGVLAWMAGLRSQAPFGLIFQDLVGPAASQSGYRGGRRVAGFTSKIELYLARRAQRVAIISEAFRPYLETAGVQVSRLHRVRNWAHPVAPTESRTATRARLGWGASDFVCLHAGSIGQKQGLDNVLRAAELLQGGLVRIAIAGDGNDRARLVEQARRMNLTNVHFLEVHPPGPYEALLQASDVLLVNQRASVKEMALPSKLTSHFASGRPTVAVAADDSATALEVRAAQAGAVVRPGDPAALAHELLAMRDAAELREAYGAHGRAYVQKYLNSSAALAEYDEFLDLLIGH